MLTEEERMENEDLLSAAQQQEAQRLAEEAEDREARRLANTIGILGFLAVLMWFAYQFATSN